MPESLDEVPRYSQADLDRLRDFAVNAEREACARVAEDYMPSGHSIVADATMIAAAIRARET